MTIPTLIDKQDNFEIVRDQIAAILALETASQMALATAAGKDPEQWRLRIFSERANPWDNLAVDTPSPVINVWWDGSTFDGDASDSVERQKSNSTYNIDCYAYGRSADNPTGGHVAGDEEAAKEAARAVRLVRNILMSADYTYLGLRGLIWNRRTSAVTPFQPQQDSQNVENVVAARISFVVGFSEFSPQVGAGVLNYLSVEVHQTDGGEILVGADYDYSI